MRRFAHSEWTFPDALVVDGNLIQVNSARQVLKTYNLEIPIIAVTKDEHHKPKALSGPKEILESHRYDILLANAEAHRYGISFHRSRRGRALF